jgi:hypothetical protein
MLTTSNVPTARKARVLIFVVACAAESALEKVLDRSQPDRTVPAATTNQRPAEGA